MDSLLTQALRKIRDATDASGGAKYPSFMEPNMKAWERQGLIERHYVGDKIPCVRITDKGRARCGDSAT
jgi:hypothetical protein